MKINELISSFEVYTTNEEKTLLTQLDNPTPIETFTERDQVIIENLIRKSLVSKIRYGSSILVVQNEQPTS